MSFLEAKLIRAKQYMLQYHLRMRGISNEPLITQFQKLPRERFVSASLADQAYDDSPLPIGFGQTISQPFIVAMMIEELNPQQGDRVLDVGAGSGYQTAILAGLAGEVFAVERIEELADLARRNLKSLGIENATILTGDGTLGWADKAPFDKIICGAAAPDIPQAWLEQLADGGKIVAPVGSVISQRIVVVKRDGEQFKRYEMCDVRFVKLIGQQGWDEGDGY